jgi:hypothetical protein
MSFDKVEDFLGTDIDPKVLEQFRQWEIYLNKISYFSGEMFCEILRKNLGGDDSLPIIMLFRNSIELVGSISSLLINLYSEPAKIILRTLLESTLYIEYLTLKDSKRRSLSFLICQYHEKLNGYKKFNMKTQQGKQFDKQLEEDEFLKGYEFKDQKLLQSHIENLESLVKLELYSKVEREYRRLKNLNPRRKPVWYEFFGGPKSIEKLAYELKLGSIYEIIYRSLSKGSHGTGVIDGYISAGEKESITNFSQIRFPYSAQFVCQFTITLSIRIMRHIIKYYLPQWDSKFKEFYKKEIRAFFMAITKDKLLVIN